jgi:hypothetical protein
MGHHLDWQCCGFNHRPYDHPHDAKITSLHSHHGNVRDPHTHDDKVRDDCGDGGGSVGGCGIGGGDVSGVWGRQGGRGAVIVCVYGGY